MDGKSASDQGDNDNYRLRQKSRRQADLGKRFRARGDVLLDGLRGLTGDLFDVMSGAVVAVLPMQTHHCREMLLNEVGLTRVPQVLAQPVIVGNVFRADRPSQRARVLLGQTLDVKHLRTGQPVDLPRPGGVSSRVATTRATSSAAIGEVRPVPKGKASTSRSRTDRLANTVNSGLSNNTVGRT